jgi:hypothetical protein
MEKWLNKNLRYITIAFIALFLIKNVQSCNRKMSLNIQTKNLTEVCDSITALKTQKITELGKEIDSLNKEILAREFLIKDLSTELKIAGVKYDEAQKRADAIQKTASSIRANTTIEVKGVERDTAKNKK